MLYPYRVFVAYSHEDQALARGLVDILHALGVCPILDEQLTPGFEFSAEIQHLIANCHVFLPLITSRSISRSWINQEIGFALALGKTIVPLAIGEIVPGFIGKLQAITIREDLNNVEQLILQHIDRIVEYDKPRAVLYEATDDNAQRAQMLADYAESVLKLAQFGRVRQRASLTTFHLPLLDPAHPVWREYFSANESETLFKALRAERVSLGKHAVNAGCALIIDSVETIQGVYERFGSASTPSRIRGLLSFLSGNSVGDVVIAVNNDLQRNSSMTLVGDWFLSHAVTSGLSQSSVKGLKESLFTRHQQTIREQIEYFDQHLDDLLSARGWTPENSRAGAIEYLTEYVHRRSSLSPLPSESTAFRRLPE